MALAHRSKNLFRLCPNPEPVTRVRNIIPVEVNQSALMWILSKYIVKVHIKNYLDESPR